MSNALAVENRLSAIMRSWLFPVEPGCERHLAQLIQKAAQRVEAAGYAADEEKLKEAENNFRRLLTEMTREAGAIYFQQPCSHSGDAAGASVPMWTVANRMVRNPGRHNFIAARSFLQNEFIPNMEFDI